jgi:hypothetical protein
VSRSNVDFQRIGADFPNADVALFLPPVRSMDTAVALVQAYLHVNGYFTVAEYSVFEAYRGDQARAVTDLDILAVRFASAGQDVRHRGRRRLIAQPFVTDPALGGGHDLTDMIVGEVKEGPARFNAAMRDPVVLEAALRRFGCCAPDDARTLIRQLLDQGQVIDSHGHRIRMVAFGDVRQTGQPAAWTVVPMRHVVRFLQAYLRQHWDVLRHAPIKDTALGVLTLIEKWGVDRDAPVNEGGLHAGVPVASRS